MEIALPKHVVDRKLASGSVAYYWTPPPKFRKICPIKNEKLGENLSQSQLDESAEPKNHAFYEWREEGTETEGPARPVYGTVKWLLLEYQRHDCFTENVSERSRPDYRNIFEQICNLPTKHARYKTVGDLTVASITPPAADKIYKAMCDGERWRTGEKAVDYCKGAWKRMPRHHPKVFSKDNANPWIGVTIKRRKRKVKPAVDRDLVYAFVDAAFDAGRPECAAAAVICFEWLQRPENVTGGYFRWTDYSPAAHEGWIQIEHHKTGAMVWHPLQDEDGTQFYPDAVDVLDRVPRRGIPVVLGPEGQKYSPTRFANIVRKVARDAGMDGFTLDACRHGGMTELEEAELTDGQGRALSAHKSQRSYEGYAKRTKQRALMATRRRIAYVNQNKK